MRSVAVPFEGIGVRYQAIELDRLTAQQTVAAMRTLDRIRASIGLVDPGESAG